MQSLVLIVHVALAVGLIGLVLLQHGKGADAGAAFGSGASATVFGARGAASFMTRMTTGLAFAFFLTSITLFYFAANRDRVTGGSVTDLPGSDESVTLPAPEAGVPAAAEESTAPTDDESGLDLPEPSVEDDAASSETAPAETGNDAGGAEGDQLDLPPSD